MKIVTLEPGDDAVVLAAADLFDEPPAPGWTAHFLADPRHHLLAAFDDGTDEPMLGFITGVETTHPDKGTELFVYELSVAEARRRQGIAGALVAALAELARSRGCYGMWVATEPDNVAALATYASAGAEPPETSSVLVWAFDRATRA